MIIVGHGQRVEIPIADGDMLWFALSYEQPLVPVQFFVVADTPPDSVSISMGQANSEDAPLMSTLAINGSQSYPGYIQSGTKVRANVSLSGGTNVRLVAAG